MNRRPRNTRNAPCPCGSGLKHKRCCLRTGRLYVPGEIVTEITPVTPEQADELALLMRTVNELQRQGHEIKGHECPICAYLEEQGLAGGEDALFPAA
jgi:hypothetical protein